jgi:hypothetical protein
MFDQNMQFPENFARIGTLKAVTYDFELLDDNSVSYIENNLTFSKCTADYIRKAGNSKAPINPEMAA